MSIYIYNCMYLANSSASPESKLKNSNSDDGMNMFPCSTWPLSLFIYSLSTQVARQVKRVGFACPG